MTRTLVIVSILAVLATTASVAAPKKNAAPGTAPTRPIVVVFDTAKGDGVDKALAASATRAICAYLRDTQRVDTVPFNSESPTVVRAIMDKQLTADQVASYSSQEDRILVARALSYDYAAGAEVSIKDDQLKVKLWVAKADGGKKNRWETTTQSTVGAGINDKDNAMQSATSAAVITIARQAFMNVPIVAESNPTTGAETTAIAPDLAAAPTPPGAADYAAQGEASLKAGDVAVAIQQYQLAVNADTQNATLRMLLVDAYVQKKMYREANAELDRAELVGASAEQVAAKRKMIDALLSGRAATRVDPHPSATQPAQTDNTSTTDVQPKAETPTSTDTPKSAVAQMLAGDKLWRSSKPDEAADAYREAIKLNPNDWRAYERLALVDASISMFTESRLTIEQLAKVQPNPTAAVLAKRYSLFSAIFAQWFNTLFKQYDDDSADYAKHVISRESYYSSIKGLNGRLESMAKFLDSLPVPEDKKDAALHRGLACGLLFQGVSSLQDYLETNSKDSKSSADTFVAQAKKEIDAVKTLEASRVAVQKQPRPAPAAPPAQDTTSPAPDQPSAGQDTNQSSPDQPTQGPYADQPAPPASPDQPAPGPDQGPPPPDQQPMGGDANPPPAMDNGRL